jgi:hypothetical protein
MNTYRTSYKLDDSLKNDLLLQAREHTEFNLYTTYKNTKTDLHFATDVTKEIKPSDATNYLKSIVNPSLELNGIAFLKFLPNKSIFPHCDDHDLRTSCLTWALSPDIDNFAPVIYHYTENKISEITYYNNCGLILNTKNMHSVVNNEFERISVQLCFSNSIQELALADLKNNLFVQ